MKNRKLFAALLAVQFAVYPVSAADVQPQEAYQTEESGVFFACNPSVSNNALTVCSMDPHSVTTDESGYHFSPEHDGTYVIQILRWTKEGTVFEQLSDLYAVESVNGEITVEFLDTLHGSFDEMDTEIPEAIATVFGTYVYDRLQLPVYFENGYRQDEKIHMLHVISDEPLTRSNGLYVSVNRHTIYDSVEAMQQNSTETHYDTKIVANRSEDDQLLGLSIVGSGQLTLIDNNDEHPMVYNIDVDKEDLIPDSLAIYDNVRYGDINGDNAFNISDIVILQKYLLCDEDGKELNWESADLNHDQRLNAVDYTLMKRGIWYF